MKKGQMQMNESIFVIFLVTFLILIGLVFFFKYTSADIKSEALEYEEFRFRQLISVVPNMPELKCSHLGISDECIDLFKAEAFADLEFEHRLFRNKEVVIKEDSSEVVLYDDLGCDDVRIVSTPISLYDPIFSRHSVAELIIRWCPE